MSLEIFLTSFSRNSPFFLLVLLVLEQSGIAGERTRSFDVSEEPAEARRIVSEMQSGDAMAFRPPGVHVNDEGSGSFSARSPVGSARAKFTVEARPGGGSRVTEHFVSKGRSACTEFLIDAVHRAATNPQHAYHVSRTRSQTNHDH